LKKPPYHCIITSVTVADYPFVCVLTPITEFYRPPAYLRQEVTVTFLSDNYHIKDDYTSLLYIVQVKYQSQSIKRLKSKD